MGKIREVTLKKDRTGRYERVRLVFGPHYFVELSEDGGKLTFVLGATHHGFKADASQIGGQLESFIEEIREKHSENRVD
jgi:hypothetical protein